MGFDRNTVIGFVLLAVLFFGYFFYTNRSQQEYTMAKKRYDDSIAALNPKPKFDSSIKYKQDSVPFLNAGDTMVPGDLRSTVNGTEELTIVDNDLMRLTFSNKGGWLKMVELKNYKGPDSTLVKMGGTASDEFGYEINLGGGHQGTAKMFFNKAVVTKTPDGTQTLSYQVIGSGTQAISHSFVIRKSDYMIDANIGITGADQFFTQQAMNIGWRVKARQQQTDMAYERTQTKLVYRTDGSFDYNAAIQTISEQLNKPTQWIGLKQQFFNSTLLTKGNFTTVKADVIVPADTVSEVATLNTAARIQVPAGSVVSVPMQIFYGPNEFKLLKSYDNDMINIVDLGSGITSFVKYINRGIIMPVFNFLSGLVGGKLGWAILLLTLFIRLIIAPLTYKSYLSGAKMKLLQPELKALKEKLGDNQQAYGMEQMKLFRQAGVNPLGGCIPAVLQIPIFFALFAFFNSDIALRGQHFLWAEDLSRYDSIAHLPFKIPGYGDHVSLFTITACLTSFFISLYSMNSTPDQSNPMMKYLPYIFPFIMLFIFNKLPSALTWYYTVSNIVTLGIQFVINTYIIDHDKILAKMAEAKTKPKTKSKWQERMEAMQDTQKKVQELKNKPGKK